MGNSTPNPVGCDWNPSARLPQTFPVSLADTRTAGSTRQYPGIFSDGSTTRPPGTSEIRQVYYDEGLYIGYKWYDAQGIEPLFPFGYGLSYTTFEYTRLQVTGVNIQANFLRSNALDFLPNLLLLDQIAERTVSTANTNATVGGGAAQVSFTTPSGTNEYHGAVYWHNRNLSLIHISEPTRPY